MPILRVAPLECFAAPSRTKEDMSESDLTGLEEWTTGLDDQSQEFSSQTLLKLSQLQRIGMEDITGLPESLLQKIFEKLVLLLRSRDKFIAYSTVKAYCQMLEVLFKQGQKGVVADALERIISLMLADDSSLCVTWCLDVFCKLVSNPSHELVSLTSGCIAENWEPVLKRCVHLPCKSTAEDDVMIHTFLRLWNKLLKSDRTECDETLLKQARVFFDSVDCALNVLLQTEQCGDLMCKKKCISVLCNSLPLSWLYRDRAKKTEHKTQTTFILNAFGSLSGSKLLGFFNAARQRYPSCFTGSGTCFVASYDDIASTPIPAQSKYKNESSLTCTSSDALAGESSAGKTVYPVPCNHAQINSLEDALDAQTIDMGMLRKSVIFILKAAAFHATLDKDISPIVLDAVSDTLGFVEHESSASDLPWLLWLFLDQDDLLMEALFCLHVLYVSITNGIQSLTNASPKETEQYQQRLHSLLSIMNPHRLFAQFILYTGKDSTLLCDFLTAPETCFLAYFTKQLRLMSGDWEQFCLSCQNLSQLPVCERVEQNDLPDDPVESTHVRLVDYDESDSESSSDMSTSSPPSQHDASKENIPAAEPSTQGTLCSDAMSPAKGQVVDDIMTVIIRLRMSVERLWESGIFPYDPRVLLSLMTRCEELYEL